MVVWCLKYTVSAPDWSPFPPPNSPPTVDFALSRPFKRGALDLQHRVVLAPLTRCRSPNNVSPALATTYYSQRASPGGLLISEGVAVSEAARGYVDVPGLWREDQVAAWRRVTEAVHARGALIFAQLWHVGRASLRAYQPGGQAPVSASAVAVGEPFLGLDPVTFQQVPLDAPQALTQEGIRQTIADFVTAATNAMAAGFDGVEVHGANGYLLEQFLSDAVNRREDAYGGSVPNRARFALELVDAVVGAVGAERVAVRLSPYNRFLNSPTSDAEEVYVRLVRELTARHALAYVHLVEGRVMGSAEASEPTPALDSVARASAAPVMLAGGYTRETGAAAVEEGRGDLVAFGRLFLANPDLPLRFAKNAPLNPPNRATFYAPPGGSDPAVGYTDYPFAEIGVPQP
ncbi:NADH:flavin oxidoreductase/NADH oxidase [Helicosporidium sp. ATCC 50920]|nr:NADH:flavin oxidoreductase/NADH oxidase [Helicosporidium sp. ATCC 50920]|eukprot:KDD75725.1 NADH:flavin oxidoreductase/NADH oxidase [Helicosporidium sp. ATCC 50920]